MKNMISTIAISALIVGTVISGCDSSSKKVEVAREEVKTSQDNAQVAQDNLNKAIQDSTNEFLKFKSESDMKIDNYEKTISAIKVKLEAEKKYNTKLNKKNLTDLEMKRAELKKTLAEYKREGRSDWTEFKNKLNKDINDLDKSIANFFVDEKKK